MFEVIVTANDKTEYTKRFDDYESAALWFGYHLTLNSCPRVILRDAQRVLACTTKEYEQSFK